MNNPQPHRRSTWRTWAVGGGLMTVVAGSVFFLSQQAPPPSPPTTKTGQPLTDSAAAKVDPREQREQFYRAEIEPLLLANRHANEQSVLRCLERIETRFVKYRRGVNELSNDLTSLSTRWSVLTRMPGNWWRDDRRIESLIQEKFEKHVFGEQQLHRDLQQALDELRTDVRASGNVMLASVQAAVTQSDLPDLSVPDYRSYDEQVRSSLVKFASDRASQSVYHGLATFVVSEVAAVAISQVVVRVMSVVGSSAASAAGVGGASAGAAAAGAGSGSVVGPVGIAIGFGVGLVVGVGVDWWMTDKFRDRLQGDLTNYLRQMEHQLLEGSSDQPGLRQALNEIVEDVQHAHAAVLQRALLGETS